jgi:hypothetical protein
MIEISPTEFLDWKSNQVTKAFFNAAEERVTDCKEILSNSAGNDTLYDRFLVGMIQAYREMQQFHIEDF